MTEVVRTAIASNDYDALSTTLGLLMIALLIGLLIARELTRAFTMPGRSEAVRLLGSVSGPLLLAFGVVIVLRLASLL